MKTPEEIKKGLECCSEDGCKGCNYEEDCYMADGFSALAYDALAYIRQLEAQAPKWVDVMDDLPVNEDDVLVLSGGKEVVIGWFNGYCGEWRTYSCVASDVTHWMPLPKPPKEGWCMRLIDADALKKEAITVDLGVMDYPLKEDVVYVSDIDDAPTIDAEPVRRGQWDANGRCTSCGGHAPYWAMATTYYKSPYCSECGAKMDLEVQDDNSGSNPPA